MALPAPRPPRPPRNDLIPQLLALRDLLRLFTRLERVAIATAAPLTVTLRDGSTVPAIGVTGLTYTAGAAGVAVLASRGQPLVLPITV